MAANIARWAVLLAAITLALLYLNSAAASAWVAGGPPTEFREAWLQRALTHLCYAVATTFGGIGVFRIMRRPLRLGRVALVLVALALVFIAAPCARRLLIAVGCRDSGGRWNGTSFKCER